jgi:hypothetical protein
VLTNERLKEAIVHRLGVEGLNGPLQIDEAMPSDLAGIDGFESLVWLFSSNYANRHMGLLMFDEAAWLYRTIRGLESPRIAELGRAKGGTTFFMAASGAQVLSVDDGSFALSWSQNHGRRVDEVDGSLMAALRRAGIDGRVELATADARNFDVTQAFDIVYVDIPMRESGMRTTFETWWPAVRPGGMYILRDGREPRVPGANALAATLATRDDVDIAPDMPGTFVVAVKR